MWVVIQTINWWGWRGSCAQMLFNVTHNPFTKKPNDLLNNVKDFCTSRPPWSIFFWFKVSQSHHQWFLIHIISSFLSLLQHVIPTLRLPRCLKTHQQTISIPSQWWKLLVMHPNACSWCFPPYDIKSSRGCCFWRADLDRLTFISSR